VNAPLPPSDLSSRRPEILTLPNDVVVERIFAAAFDPIHFDRGRNGRLNAPDGAYGVLYVAQQLRGAFAETFLREPSRTLLPLDLIRRKARVRLRLSRRLTLIDLRGYGLARVGATAEIVHGGLPYDAPQAWSKALHDHPLAPDGIAYTARHDDGALCYALFDRSADSLTEFARERDLDQDWFWELAEKYGVGLAPY
jgi:hypothetical protein